MADGEAFAKDSRLGIPASGGGHKLAAKIQRGKLPVGYNSSDVVEAGYVQTLHASENVPRRPYLPVRSLFGQHMTAECQIALPAPFAYLPKKAVFEERMQNAPVSPS